MPTLTSDARKTISRWTKRGWYVYIRPMSSTLIDARKKHSLYWVVSLEIHGVPPVQLRGEGTELSEIIEDLDARAPVRKANPPTAGWLAPKEVFDREVKEAQKKLVRKASKTVKAKSAVKSKKKKRAVED